MPQRSSSQMLCVHVIDVNDEVPWFEESHYEAQIFENKPAGTSVLTVSGSDLDQGEVKYATDKEYFTSDTEDIILKYL